MTVRKEATPGIGKYWFCPASIAHMTALTSFGVQSTSG